ncbi:MAG: L-threonylcarbamoyladenylate synthase [Bacteroidota bacterium]|nr:L-threonylcarbamoyladenylate synthase [Bacteroidota bacterium]
MAEIGVDLFKAAVILKNDDVVAIPTETVYGLAANGLSAKAITKVFEVKNRPAFDPLIVHTSSLDRIFEFVEMVPEKAMTLFKQFSPGPLTILLPKNNIIPDIVTSGLPLVGIRIPNHTITLELLKDLPFPLAAPSANPFGYVSPTQASHVQDQLGNKIPYILDGGSCVVGVESTIVGFEGNKTIIYRQGGITKEAIESTLGESIETRISSSKPMAPGMLQSHYAPGKKIILGDIKSLIDNNINKKIAILSFATDFQTGNDYILSKTSNLAEAAQNLFAHLRAMDALDIDVIFAEYVPNLGIGRAINDRLKRAAFHEN